MYSKCVATYNLANTYKYVTVCAGSMESNERLNIGKEQELIQLEQTSCNALWSGFELSYIF